MQSHRFGGQIFCPKKTPAICGRLEILSRILKREVFAAAAKAFVENETVPRFPVIMPPPPNPVITAKVDPDRVSPVFEPLSVPPVLLKSTPLSANDAAGIIRQARKRDRVRTDLPENINRAPC